MMNQKKTLTLEYGDFQTPLFLARKICQKLVSLGVEPDVIIEPTCGMGNFLIASAKAFPQASHIWGIEINADYIQEFEDPRIKVKQGNFFNINWDSYFQSSSQKTLIIGNFPWVTNSQQGIINGTNLPHKTNFQGHSGLDAITGKSNFDISEWMLIQTITQLQNRYGYIAMLCKTSVSRKILNYFHHQQYNLKQFSFYKIDMQQYFGVSVDAGLLFCKIIPNCKQYYCDVFEDLDTQKYQRIGYYNHLLVNHLDRFKDLSFLYSPQNQYRWRSGIKHDCSKVMELRKINHQLVNGFNEEVDIEETYLFPLLKGSKIANQKTETTDRYVLVPQRFIGQSTEMIQDTAPKTWNYLQKYAKLLDKRKSKIYQKQPRFSIFGVGEYTFYPWKIAIAGLYKQLNFQLISQIESKPVMFDDTVYFLSFTDEKIARKVFSLLTSQLAMDFYACLIFWDEKRPIKASILNCLNIDQLEKLYNRAVPNNG